VTASPENSSDIVTHLFRLVSSYFSTTGSPDFRTKQVLCQVSKLRSQQGKGFW
jgi:hypothetical protein